MSHGWHSLAGSHHNQRRKLIAALLSYQQVRTCKHGSNQDHSKISRLQHHLALAHSRDMTLIKVLSGWLPSNCRFLAGTLLRSILDHNNNRNMSRGKLVSAPQTEDSAGCKRCGSACPRDISSVYLGSETTQKFGIGRDRHGGHTCICIFCCSCSSSSEPDSSSSPSSPLPSASSESPVPKISSLIACTTQRTGEQLREIQKHR